MKNTNNDSEIFLTFILSFFALVLFYFLIAFFCFLLDLQSSNSTLEATKEMGKKHKIKNERVNQRDSEPMLWLS